MGLNISAYILKDNNGNIETEDFGFDSDKYSGDGEFVTTDLIEWEYVQYRPNYPDYIYKRPKDLDIAIDWVKNNIYEGNQERLINLLEAMKENKNLYIYCGW